MKGHDSTIVGSHQLLNSKEFGRDYLNDNSLVGTAQKLIQNRNEESDENLSPEPRLLNGILTDLEEQKVNLVNHEESKMITAIESFKKDAPVDASIKSN